MPSKFSSHVSWVALPIELTAIATINRGAATKGLVSAVVEVLVDAKLERTDSMVLCGRPRNWKVPSKPLIII
jgi:hypothetical protein